mgnify:CR=1 FL=1
MRIREIFGLEKDFLRFYKSHPETVSKAEMMHMLAIMKERTEFDNDFKQATDSVLFADKDIDTTHYDIIPFTDYNQLALLLQREPRHIEAAAGQRQSRHDGAVDKLPDGRGHAGRRGCARGSCRQRGGHNRKQDAAGASDDNRHEAIRDYIAAANGYPLRFDWKYAGELEPYAGYYGAGSRAYLSLPVIYGLNLGMAAGASSVADVMKMEQIYDATARITYADDPGQYIMDKMCFMQAYEKSDVTTLASRLQELTAMALDRRLKPSWRLFAAARRLAQACNRNGRSRTHWP